jgi:hypothetical protein
VAWRVGLRQLLDRGTVAPSMSGLPPEQPSDDVQGPTSELSGDLWIRASSVEKIL